MMLDTSVLLVFHVVGIAAFASGAFDVVKEFVWISFFVHLDVALRAPQFLWLIIVIHKIIMGHNHAGCLLVIDDFRLLSHDDGIGEAVAGLTVGKVGIAERMRMDEFGLEGDNCSYAELLARHGVVFATKVVRLGKCLHYA